MQDIKLVSKNAMFNVGASAQMKAIRGEAIKWIKADIKVAQSQEPGVDSKMLAQCMRWANRFNITKDDLKVKKR